jgi:hypothetical protein
VRLPWCRICVSRVLFGCLLEWLCCHVCFSLYSHACLSFFILQIRCGSQAIGWRAQFQVRLPWCRIWVSRVLFGCLLEWLCCHVCFSLYSHAYLSFFILQIRCILTRTAWQELYHQQLGSLLNWVSVVLFGCLLSCSTLYSHACSSFKFCSSIGCLQQ